MVEIRIISDIIDEVNRRPVYASYQTYRDFLRQGAREALKFNLDKRKVREALITLASLIHYMIKKIDEDLKHDESTKKDNTKWFQNKSGLSRPRRRLR